MTTYTLKIESLAFGGDGVAVLPDGKKCFVPCSVPGDVAEVEILQEKKRFARGKIRRILTPSPIRIEPFCPLRKDSMPCPSCVYAELPYEEELRWKEEQFEFFLTRGGLAGKEIFEPPFPSPVRTGYRSKITLSCENGVAGYRAADNKTLLPVKECLLARKSINTLLAGTSLTPEMKRLNFRWTLADGAVCRVFPERNGTHRSRLLTEQIGPYGTFRVPEKSFFQVNIHVAAELIRRVLAVIDEKETDFLLELYCGAGIFSLAAAVHLPSLRTHGVELDGDAVHAAKNNAAYRQLHTRCHFQCADAADFSLPAGVDPAKLLLLTDPPRTGMDEKLIRRILELGPERILYISCAPDMLRRDLDMLDGKYRIHRAGLLDMFPSTAHFESMTLLEKR